jgi:hypothetical protein
MRDDSHVRGAGVKVSRVIVCSLAVGGWYPRGAARLITEMERVSPGYEVKVWVNTLPFGAPADVVEAGYSYTAYCAKPFALLAAHTAGADIAILVDAAMYPIRPIHPLVDHIAQTGYFFCRNGNRVGDWCSDRAMERMGQTRKKLDEMEEISSYCVGLNFADGRCIELLHRWCGFSADRLTVPGPHTGLMHEGRNRGFVSVNPRVKGHRHDQTVLSVLAHQIGMGKLVSRPKFTAYKGSSGEETVFENWGGI